MSYMAVNSSNMGRSMRLRAYSKGAAGVFVDLAEVFILPSFAQKLSLHEF